MLLHILSPPPHAPSSPPHATIRAQHIGGLTNRRFTVIAAASAGTNYNVGADSTGSSLPSPCRTQRIMESISANSEVGGAGGAYSYNALKRLDQLWSHICSADSDGVAPGQVVTSIPASSFGADELGETMEDYDVLVCGGTLGIFIAAALCHKGLRVGIIEKNLLQGREQEWNISMKELQELVEVGIVTEDEIKQAVSVMFNPNRCGFEGKGEIWVNDILNLGVLPAKLLEIVKQRFLSSGGTIFEGHGVSSIEIYEDAAVLRLSNGKLMKASLVLDAMGNFSPIVRQIRSGKKPDGVCLVVGSCCRGFEDNRTSDVIFSSKSAKKLGNSEVQYFWEAFPAGSGPGDRTTYMFTYLETKPSSPKLEQLLEDYWELMPDYQGISFERLQVLRVIFGIFPTYRDSPLPAAFNRIIQVGDASGIQSPVSFGGFGSMTRHLCRLSTGIYEAVKGKFLDADSLSMLNPYMPNLSSSWLFQRAMSAKSNSDVSTDFIPELLYVNFACMQRLGDPVLRPFLQDVIQFAPLVKTLGLVMLTKPLILPSIFKQVGVNVLLDWSLHFFMLGYYTFLSTSVDPILRPWLSKLSEKEKFKWKRTLEAWKYGSGLDYEL